MKRLFLAPAVACALFLTHCAFNVEEQVRTLTAHSSSVGVSTVTLKGDGFETNDISVAGIPAESCFVSMSVRRLVLRDDDWAEDRLRLSMDDKGKVTYRSSGTDWSAVKISDISLRVDRTKALDIGLVTGDIAITGMQGFSTVSSTTGDISVETVTGCRVTATTGDITVKVLADSVSMQRITVTVTTGDITVRVPAGFKARTECTTTTGTVSMPGGGEGAGLNGGGANDPLIQCSSTTGDVSIKEY
jgi:hypothetical protein